MSNQLLKALGDARLEYLPIAVMKALARHVRQLEFGVSIRRQSRGL